MKLLKCSLLLMLLNAFCQSLFATDVASIIIRQAVAADLLSALHLDSHIMIEYFKPLFIKHYPDTLGKDPDYFLSLDLKTDLSLFHDCIHQKCNEKLYVAFDSATQRVVGLTVFHQESDDVIEIDLLFIHKNYQRLGLGKRLLNTARESYSNIKKCGVYVFSHNNDALAFYMRQGFNILGPGPQDKKMVYGLSYADLCVYCLSNSLQDPLFP